MIVLFRQRVCSGIESLGPRREHSTIVFLLVSCFLVFLHKKSNSSSRNCHFSTFSRNIRYNEPSYIYPFFRLNQSLQWPYKEVIATALYDFEPRAGSNQLQLRTDFQVLVIGKDGDSKGWWRGKIGDTVSTQGSWFQCKLYTKVLFQVGYFPKDYVQEQKPASEELWYYNYEVYFAPKAIKPTKAAIGKLSGGEARGGDVQDEVLEEGVTSINNCSYIAS